MVIVTRRAKAKLEETLRLKRIHPRQGIRLVLAPLSEKPLNFILDHEEPGDLVIKSDQGSNLLFLRPYLIPALEGMVIDYQETLWGPGFTLSRRRPVN